MLYNIDMVVFIKKTAWQISSSQQNYLTVPFSFFQGFFFNISLIKANLASETSVQFVHTA